MNVEGTRVQTPRRVVMGREELRCDISYFDPPRRVTERTRLPSEATGLASDTEEAGGHKALDAFHASTLFKTRAPILDPQQPSSISDESPRLSDPREEHTWFVIAKEACRLRQSKENLRRESRRVRRDFAAACWDNSLHPEATRSTLHMFDLHRRRFVTRLTRVGVVRRKRQLVHTREVHR